MIYWRRTSVLLRFSQEEDIPRIELIFTKNRIIFVMCNSTVFCILVQHLIISEKICELLSNGPMLYSEAIMSVHHSCFEI